MERVETLLLYSLSVNQLMKIIYNRSNRISETMWPKQEFPVIQLGTMWAKQEISVIRVNQSEKGK